MQPNAVIPDGEQREPIRNPGGLARAAPGFRGSGFAFARNDTIHLRRFPPLLRRLAV